MFAEDWIHTTEIKTKDASGGINTEKPPLSLEAHLDMLATETRTGKTKRNSLETNFTTDGEEGQQQTATDSEQRDKISNLSDRVSTLESETGKQYIDNRVQERIDTTLHAPATLGGGLAVLALSIGLLASGSIFWIPVVGLSVFMLITFRKIKSNHQLAVRDVI